MDEYYRQKVKEDEERHKNWAKQRQRLIEVCNEALIKPEFQRDYMYKGNTYCNQGSEYILKKLGYYTQFFYSYWKERKRWIVTTANQIYDKCRKDKTLKRIDLRIAHLLAWQGIPSLIIAKSKDRKKWGHVSVTYPSPLDEPLLVCNIGWENLICSPKHPKSFAGGDHYLSAWDIWEIPKITV